VRFHRGLPGARRCPGAPRPTAAARPGTPAPIHAATGKRVRLPVSRALPA